MTNTPYACRKQFPTRILKPWEHILKTAKLRPIDDSLSVSKYNYKINESYNYISDGSIDSWLLPEEFEIIGGCRS